jgi:hypothetical protein
VYILIYEIKRRYQSKPGAGSAGLWDYFNGANSAFDSAEHGFYHPEIQ